MARKQATNSKSARKSSRSQPTSLSKPVMRAADNTHAEVANMPAGALIDNVTQASESTPLTTALQTKLTVGAVGDPYEQEADRVARQVVDQLHSSKPSSGLNPNDAPVQRQVQIDHHTAANMQADMGLEGGSVSGEVESTINSAKSGGQPLSAKTKTSMGSAMGADFSSVKVHTDSTSDQLNRSMQSRAFTTGSHIFFKKGEYSPGNRSGQELLAHELTHTVQQGASPQVQQQAMPQQASEPNRTGMPLQLKAGVESLSGMSMGDVKVHYNSPEPAKIGALAYTRGTDIHLAPKQEQHLAHEAWHVVQQKQGRVPVTTQFKKLAGNDSPALEREADVMGAKAAAFTGAQPVGMVQQGLMQRQVVQARLPEMSDETILDQQDITKEILLHSLRNMEDAEAKKMLDTIFPDTIDPTQDWDLSEYKPLIADTIKNPSNPNILVEAYHYISNNIGGDKKFELYTGPAGKAIGGMQVPQIIGQLSTVIGGLKATLANGELKEGIFGPEYNQGRVNSVLTSTIQGINEHLTKTTSPALVFGDKEHLEWAGVGGYTEMGAPQVKLGQKAVDSLAGGGASGMATLVHEFTHARGKTSDHSYGIKGAARLTPDERVDNATTYQYAFLTALGHGNPDYYYNEDVVSGKKGAADSKEDEKEIVTVRKNAVGKMRKVLTAAKSLLVNSYNFGRDIFHDEMMGDEEKRQGRALIKAATVPHEIAVNEGNLSMTLALIEDRTRFLHELKKNLKKEVKQVSSIELKALQNKPVELLTLITKDELNMSEYNAKKWYTYLEDKTWQKAIRDYIV